MKLSDKKRQNILSAAEQLFCELGVEATSMDAVAAQAQVSKRTVYNHFATKDVLFRAIVESMQAQLAAPEEIVYRPGRPLAMQLQAIARQEIALLLSENFLAIARIAFVQLLQNPALAKSLSSKPLGCIQYLETFLASAVASDALVIEDIPFAAKQFVYQLKALIFYPSLLGFEPPAGAAQTQIVMETVAMFLARYQVPGLTPEGR